MTKITLSLTLVAAMSLSACVDQATAIQDPNYRTKDGATTGAIIGGMIGLAAGGSSHEARLRSTLLGAALGAAAGGAIGANLDQQAADLRNNLGNPNVTVTNKGGYLVVNLPQDVTFVTDSAAVRPDLQATIRSVAANLITYPNSTIQVVGHTDNTGAAAYNVDLSQRRAVAVRDILIGAGVPTGRLQAYGVGEDQPIASNLTESGRAANRRVEIIIRPKT